MELRRAPGWSGEALTCNQDKCNTLRAGVCCFSLSSMKPSVKEHQQLSPGWLLTGPECGWGTCETPWNHSVSLILLLCWLCEAAWSPLSWWRPGHQKALVWRLESVSMRGVMMKCHITRSSIDVNRISEQTWTTGLSVPNDQSPEPCKLYSCFLLLNHST